MRFTTRIAGLSVLAALGTVCLTGPVSAHEGAIGDGGPFTIRIDEPAQLPDGIEARWGNGEVEFHIEPGIEMIAFGVDGEPMAKVDKDGNMFGNTLSPTWQMSKSSDMSSGMDTKTDAKADPNWEWQQAGGSLMYHEHRIHFMASSVDPAIAEGGDVSTFALDYTVNGEPLTIKGALVFDPSLDAAKAEALIEAGKNWGGSDKPGTHGDHEHHENGTGFPTVALVAVVVVAVVAGGLGLRHKFGKKKM